MTSFFYVFCGGKKRPVLLYLQAWSRNCGLQLLWPQSTLMSSTVNHFGECEIKFGCKFMAGKARVSLCFITLWFRKHSFQHGKWKQWYIGGGRRPKTPIPGTPFVCQCHDVPPFGFSSIVGAGGIIPFTDIEWSWLAYLAERRNALT